MRNLKKLFAVLLAVAMIASMMVPALAAVDYQDEALSLQAIKVFAGGPDDLKLEEGVTRAQGLAFAIRVAGKEAEALAMADADVDAILADWVDASELTGGAAWARKYVAYAVKTEMTLGVGGKKLAALENITGTSLMVFVLKAMGYSEATTANIAELVVDKGVMSAGDAAKFAAIQSGLVRDDAAGILFNAFANGVNKDGTKLIDAYIASGATTEAAAAEAGFVEVLDAVTAAAVGARKIEVKFNKAVDTAKATIEIKRGNIKPSVKSTTWAEDKKSAVIEFTTDLATDNYTVKVTGVTEEALTATTKVEAAKLVSIKFKSDIAIMSSSNAPTAMNDRLKATVVAENQYGEDITNSLDGTTVNVSKGTSATISKGVITVSGNHLDYKVDEKVVIIVVKDGVVVSQTLTIASAAAVESIEFGELTTDDKDLKGKEINVAAMTTNATKYYLPITVKDQYGNVLNASELLTGFTVTSSNTDVVKLATAPYIVDQDGKTVIKFQTTGKAQSGTVLILAYSNLGKSANTTIVVKDNAKIDTVTMSAPEKELKLTKEAVLPLTIVDTYGNEVALKDVTNVDVSVPGEVTITDTAGGTTKITASGASFSTDMDYIKKERTISITPTSKNVILMVTTANNKYQSLTLTANDAPAVSGIKGVKADFATMLANNASLKTPLAGNVVFVDQYGDEIAAPAFDFDDTVDALDYTFAAKDAANAVTTYTASAAGEIYASTNAGTEVYVVTLKKAGTVLDTYEVTITVVDGKKVTEFGIEDLDKFYTAAAAASTHKQTVEIYGLVDGKKVIVPQSMISYVSASNGLKGIDPLTGEFVPVNADTESKDKTSVITVLVDNGATTVTVTKEVVFSNATPAAASLTIKYDGKEVKADTIQVPAAELAASKGLVAGVGTASKLQISAKDQYGKDLNTLSHFTLVATNNSAGGAIEDGAVKTAFTGAGESFVLNVFNNGIQKTLKVVIK